MIHFFLRLLLFHSMLISAFMPFIITFKDARYLPRLGLLH